MIVGRGTHVIHGVVQLFFFFVGDDEKSNFGGPAGDALFAGSQNRPKSTKTLFRVTILFLLFLRRLLTEGVCSIVVSPWEPGVDTPRFLLASVRPTFWMENFENFLKT
jgi:hypothetical protein